MQNCSVRKAAKLNNSKLKSTVSLYVLHNTGVYMYFVDRKTKNSTARCPPEGPILTFLGKSDLVGRSL
jgi:hypothetical protein